MRHVGSTLHQVDARLWLPPLCWINMALISEMEGSHIPMCDAYT